MNYLKTLKVPYVQTNSYNNASPNKKHAISKWFYILTNANKYVSVKLKKKAILNVFSDQETALKKYVKAKKLSFKEENDVAELLASYH